MSKGLNIMRQTTLIIFISFFTHQVFADDLSSIYKFAVNNDPKYQAAINQYNAVQEIKIQSRSVLLPQLNATGYSSNVEQDVTGGLYPGERKFDSAGYSVEITQSIYERENYVGLNLADANVSKALSTLEDLE